MITYRKTKANAWVAYGAATEVKTGTVTIYKASGASEARVVETLGRPFAVDGVQMVYGYLVADARPARPASTSRAANGGSGMCDECHTRRATTTAHDMSGIPGRVCGVCKRDEGTLSFC